MFEIGQPVEEFYFVKGGILSVEVEVSVQQENKYPTKNYEWELCSKTRNIRYETYRLKVGEIFGLQELVDFLTEKNH